MIRQILVGIDGSRYSRSAVELALRWASRHSAELIGLAIIDEPPTDDNEAVGIGADFYKQHRQEQIDDSDDRGLSLLNAAIDDFSRKAQEAQLVYQVRRDKGEPSKLILAIAQTVDVVLLGQETHFHIECVESPDDTLQQVLFHCPTPVVVVPRSLPQGEPVVVAYDASPQARRALESLVKLRVDDEAPVYVVSVHTDLKQAREWADEGVRLLAAAQIRAVPSVVEYVEMRAGEAIRAEVRRLGARMLVTGVEKHSWWHDFFFGSTSTDLLRDSDVVTLTHC